MPAPRHRSRNFARSQRRAPGGRTETVYSRRKPQVHKCAECKIELKGIPRMTTVVAKNARKSHKTVERKYGGFLCSSCAREKIKAQARSIQ